MAHDSGRKTDSGRSQLNVVLVGIIALSFFIGGCSGDSSEDPKKTVISMFGAMEKNDQAALTNLLDLNELMKNNSGDYAFQTENPRTWNSPQDILNDLTGEGKTKQVWFKLQRIVNKSSVMGETATVEVTFVDKEASRGYRTAFGLHRVQGKWKIYSFQVYDSPS